MTARSQPIIHLEDTSLTQVLRDAGRVRIGLANAAVYLEDYIEVYEAELIFSDAEIESDIRQLPAEISEASLHTEGMTYYVFLPLPFVVEGPCRIDALTRNGGRVAVRGSSCRIELGPSIRQPYIWESDQAADDSPK